jgi:hypothetical protein
MSSIAFRFNVGDVIQSGAGNKYEVVGRHEKDGTDHYAIKGFGFQHFNESWPCNNHTLITPATTNETENTMHTTTITKTNTETKSIDVSVGDVFIYGGPTAVHPAIFIVTEIDLTSPRPLKIRNLSPGVTTNATTWEPLTGGLAGYTQLRPADAQPTTAEVATTDEVVVSHKFQVGDTIRKNYFGGRPQHTIEAIELHEKSGKPIYRYVWPSTFDWLDSIDRADVTVVSGPSCVEPVKSGLDILREARALIADPKHWVKNSYADPDMGAFCTIGAINKVAHGKAASEPRFNPSWEVAAAALANVVGGNQYGDTGAIINFNDREGVFHDHVLAAFDKAIADLVLADVL